MKRHLLSLFVICLIGILSSMRNDVFLHNQVFEAEETFISDKQQSDIASYFDAANSSKAVLPELQSSLPLHSLRHISSQKKNQHNFFNSIITKRFYAETLPVKNNNTKSTVTLSLKDDLIVIVRHLRI